MWSECNRFMTYNFTSGWSEMVPCIHVGQRVSHQTGQDDPNVHRSVKWWAPNKWHRGGDCSNMYPQGIKEELIWIIPPSTHNKDPSLLRRTGKSAPQPFRCRGNTAYLFWGEMEDGTALTKTAGWNQNDMEGTKGWLKDGSRTLTCRFWEWFAMLDAESSFVCWVKLNVCLI